MKIYNKYKYACPISDMDTCNAQSTKKNFQITKNEEADSIALIDGRHEMEPIYDSTGQKKI